jgi:hypothetical protein
MPEYIPNPYLPSNTDKLSALLMSFGQGITASDMAGRGILPGIGIGAGLYGQAQAQAQQEAEKALQWRQQYEQQDAYRKAQEENLKEQAEARRREGALTEEAMGYLRGGGLTGGPQTAGVPGFGVPAQAPSIGPTPVSLIQQGAPKVDYLTKTYGVTPLQASAVVGNLGWESSFNPTATHDGGRGYGMAGWDPQRTAALQQFAKAQGKSPSDPQAQLDFVMSEMKGGDMGAQRAYAMLQRARTPTEATAAMMHYFRPQGYTPNNPTAGHGFANRVQYVSDMMPGAVPQSGNPQISTQATPTTVQPPRVDPMRFLPLTMSKTLAPLGQAGIQLGNAETDRYLRDLERETKTEQWRQEQALRANNSKVGPDGKPNQAMIDAETEAARRKAEIEAENKLKNEAALKLAEAEMGRYSKEVRPGVEAAANSLPNLYEMKRLTEGPLSAGSFIDARQVGARFLDTLGVAPMANGMINRTEFNNRAGKNVLAILQTRALGSGTGISEGDRKFVEKMAASGGDFTNDELKRLVSIGIDAQKTAIEQHDQSVGRLRKLPGVASISEDYFKVPFLSYEDWAKANPQRGGMSLPADPNALRQKYGLTPAAPDNSGAVDLRRKYGLQ